jgi:hypothetical protein
MKATLFETLACCLGMIFAAQPAATQSAGRITRAELGTGVTDQYEILKPATEFPPDTAKIFCVWKAEGILKGTSVRGVWIAVDVGNVAPPNYKIDEAEVHFPVMTEGSVSLSKPTNGFPAGKYRLDLYIGKELAKTIPFTVKAR